MHAGQGDAIVSLGAGIHGMSGTCVSPLRDGSTDHCAAAFAANLFAAKAAVDRPGLDPRRADVEVSRGSSEGWDIPLFQLEHIEASAL
jgi:hypothetical protein